MVRSVVEWPCCGLWQVSELEKRESRLKEVFKTQVSNFREACFCLFGYRVDMASQVRINYASVPFLENVTYDYKILHSSLGTI